MVLHYWASVPWLFDKAGNRLKNFQRELFKTKFAHQTYLQWRKVRFHEPTWCGAAGGLIFFFTPLWASCVGYCVFQDLIRSRSSFSGLTNFVPLSDQMTGENPRRVMNHKPPCWWSSCSKDISGVLIGERWWSGYVSASQSKGRVCEAHHDPCSLLEGETTLPSPEK